jgi:hypothetical protein
LNKRLVYIHYLGILCNVLLLIIVFSVCYQIETGQRQKKHSTKFIM